MEKQSQQPEKHYDKAEGSLDSPVNTDDAHDFGKQSRTNDESADTDPNEVPDKASFEDDEDKTDDNQFDGEIKI